MPGQDRRDNIPERNDKKSGKLPKAPGLEIADSSIIIIGPPSAGKGTHSKKLADLLNVPHISTGELLRTEARSGSELGKKTKAIIDKGQLLADTDIMAIVKERLRQGDCTHGFILDGCPRTAAQAESLDAIIKELNLPPVYILELQVPESQLIKRMNKRKKNSTQRNDDTEDILKKRITIYEKNLTGILNHYKKTQATSTTVNGNGNIEEVGKDIIDKLTSDRAPGSQ